VEGSAAAAQAAVTAACAAVEPHGPGPDVAWADVFAAADAAVVEAGGATTLVVAVVDGDGRGTVARTGDSTALLLDAGRWIEVWPPPPAVDDRPISTATAALPVRSGSAVDIHAADVELGADTALVLVTDGIAGPLRDGPTTVAPALAEGLVGVPSPLGLAVLTDFSRQGCFDDRTVIALWRRPDEPSSGDPTDPATDPGGNDAGPGGNDADPGGNDADPGEDDAG
jgi:serine/threonine protein phosphatase PrpC